MQIKSNNNMKNSRRDFIKMAGLAGLSLPVANVLYAKSVEEENHFNELPKQIEKYQKNHKQRFNMSGYAAPKISTVRIGIIGTGSMGRNHMRVVESIPEFELTCAADISKTKLSTIGTKVISALIPSL